MKAHLKGMKHKEFRKLDKEAKIKAVTELINDHPDFVENLLHSYFIKTLKEEGSSCPCCNQLVKVYRRKLNSNMCIFLSSLVKKVNENILNGGVGYVHYSECEFSGRDYNQLAHWGLIEALYCDKTKKRTSGMWTITEYGEDFVKGKVKVREYILCYNGRAKVDEESEMISFENALGSTFNYKELMDGM